MRAPEVGLLGEALVISALVRLPTLGTPLVGRHSFRETQTAYTAVRFASDGIDLLAPRLPVLGPPFEVPFEFPLFQAGAALMIRGGLSPTVAMRGLALVCFLATAGLLWLPAPHRQPRDGRGRRSAPSC